MDEHSDISLDTANLVLSAAREVFSAEERRSFSLLSKAQTLATITSIYFAALAFLKFTGLIAIVISQFAIACGFISMLFCVLVIRNREFHRNRLPDTKTIITYKMSAAQMAAKLAETYRDAADKNRPVLDNLYAKFQIASFFSLASVLLGVVALISTNWRI